MTDWPTPPELCPCCGVRLGGNYLCEQTTATRTSPSRRSFLHAYPYQDAQCNRALTVCGGRINLDGTAEAPHGFHPGTRIPRKAPARDEFNGRGACKFCGQTGLVWERQGERWALVEVGGKRHECPRGVK